MREVTLSRIRKNDLRAVSRLISIIENDLDCSKHLLNSLFIYAQQAIRIGITGPPGAGKSTLSDHMISEFRSEGKTVGVVSVDPTSPFTGGAFLGDRIRMNRHFLDNGVYIRSMGSRGEWGGLAHKSQQVADILACSGKDYILFETIGVGQAEVEIVKNVDITIVILVPESGDEVQVMKAGPIEIGDIFVVNKSDREGANRISQFLEDYLENTSEGKKFKPKVFQTVGIEGKGIKELYQHCMNLLIQLKRTGILEKRRQEQYRIRVRSFIRDKLEQKFWTQEREMLLEKKLLELKNDLSPYQAAQVLLQQLK